MRRWPGWKFFLGRAQRSHPATAISPNNCPYSAPSAPCPSPPDPGASCQGAGTQQRARSQSPPKLTACRARSFRSQKGRSTAAAAGWARKQPRRRCGAYCNCRRSVQIRCRRGATGARTRSPTGAPRARLCGSPTKVHPPLPPCPHLTATHTISIPPHPAAQKTIPGSSISSRRMQRGLQRCWAGGATGPSLGGQARR